MYCLIDPEPTHSIVTLYVAMHLDCGPKSLLIFFVSTPIKDLVIVSRVYQEM